MILIISGTNRKNNKTSMVARQYFDMLIQHHEKVKMLELENLPVDFIFPEVYDNQTEAVKKIQDEYVIPANKFVFIIPEYNGGLPGILKLFLDVMDWKPAFNSKKATLVGLSDGRSGNLRGLDSMTAILHHMNVTVLPFKVTIPHFDKEIEVNGKITNTHILQRIEKQIHQLIGF